ncbi:MAG: dihydrofolate reductase [Nanobdellota archaeon]
MVDMTIIGAVAKNGVIGKDNAIPWYIPDDFKRFKSLTVGSPVIMGRKTFESLPSNVRPLPGRKNIVLSRNKELELEGAVVVNSMESALEHVSKHDKAFIIGGSHIYKKALPFANTLEITHIHKEYEGDAYFPEVDWDDFDLVNKDVRDGFSFHTYKRV